MPALRPLLLVVALPTLLSPAGAMAASAPDDGAAFAPADPGPARYAVSATPISRTVVAADGVQLHTDTWLPVAKDGGPKPPNKLPVVLWISPYSTQDTKESAIRVDPLVSRGYAFTQANVRGSGGSGGCIEQTAEREVDDGARFVEDAGEKAPWSSGAVGTFGSSYRGGTQLAAATGPDRRRLRSLKALVVGNPVASAYEFFNHDGVPHLLQAPLNVVAYFAYESNPQDAPTRLPERPGCQPPIALGAADTSGDFTPFYAARDYSRFLDRITAPVLMWHGHADTRVPEHGQIGLFDGLPAGLPKHGLFGVFDHEYPDAFRANTPEPRASWQRADWMAEVIAWFDRYLRGKKNGVDDWPVAEVQGTDGQWRTATDWPRAPGGRAGRLLLGGDGALGATSPSGSTTYTELPAVELTGSAPPPGAAAVFTTPPLTDRLELWGVPQLDAWVTLDQPDAHLAVKLEALGPDGAVTLTEGRAIGARSVRHLDGFVNGRFRQAQGKDAPVGVPLRVPVRLGPTDFVVPKGGRLRLTITGSVQAFDGLDGVSEGLGAVVQGPTAPSGSSTRVEVLHDCAHPSTLSFLMPDGGSQLLDVREADQDPATLGTSAPAATTGAVDGGGLARATACGKPVDDTGTARRRLRLSVRPHRRSVRGAARLGVRVRTACSAACRVRLRLEVPRTTARTLGIRSAQPTVVLGRRAVTLSASRSTELVVRLAARLRSRLAHRRRLALTVIVIATTQDGLRDDRRKRIVLRG